MADHTHLADLMVRQVTVRVVNPEMPDSPWTGKIYGLADYPSIVLAEADGHRVVLPQEFDVEEVSDPNLDAAQLLSARTVLQARYPVTRPMWLQEVIDGLGHVAEEITRKDSDG
jgi:hypothetical protein